MSTNGKADSAEVLDAATLRSVIAEAVKQGVREAAEMQAKAWAEMTMDERVRYTEKKYGPARPPLDMNADDATKLRYIEEHGIDGFKAAVADAAKAGS